MFNRFLSYVNPVPLGQFFMHNEKVVFSLSLISFMHSMLLTSSEQQLLSVSCKSSNAIRWCHSHNVGLSPHSIPLCTRSSNLSIHPPIHPSNLPHHRLHRPTLRTFFNAHVHLEMKNLKRDYAVARWRAIKHPYSCFETQWDIVGIEDFLEIRKRVRGLCITETLLLTWQCCIVTRPTDQ